MVETERSAGVSYLTCNERHHELMLIQDPVRRGYDHVALEVEDAAALAAAMRSARGRGRSDPRRRLRRRAGHRPRGARLAPGGHVFKLFCGMETVAAADPGDRPEKFEHASVKVLKDEAARALPPATGSASASAIAWARPPAGGTATTTTTAWRSCRAPRSELSHYAFTVEDLNAMGRVADRLKLHRDQRLIWGPSRHGPGNNQFMYFHDHDGAMIELCSDIAQMWRLPAPQVAGRSEADQPVGRAAARAVHPHRVPAGEADRRPAAVRDAA